MALLTFRGGATAVNFAICPGDDIAAVAAMMFPQGTTDLQSIPDHEAILPTVPEGAVVQIDGAELPVPPEE